MTTLHIDWTRCQGRGGCVELLPELIGRDEWGYPLTGTDVAVPRALHGHARQAVRDCPRLALRLEQGRDTP
ncbi:MAG: ferredoxin [Pseudonocardiales bacterium]|jgi:ferredoxin|uniref:ferredoxin n=1 Tax=Pseudonocardia sp. TaxID=60912 RepID=UPI00261D0220|nr:ferredoxin [Pseudonocardia sp.]MCW2720656.1 oxidoreductase [Pseudonocardia sp.]MDT7617212.1 ferredoxin [Pseudonocardiales bacterium]MDT7705994.1 ferredoxin [Pseudonocardiales bacterium]